MHIDARFVIDATGRIAHFAMRQGAQLHREDRLVGMSVAYRRPGGYPPGDGTTLIEASRDGWWYSAVLPDRALLVAWMSDADLIHAARLRDADTWRTHLLSAGATWDRVAGGATQGPPRFWAAGTQYLAVPQGDGWAAAGDAACAWDPLSSAGILKALRTGRLAAFVALDAMQGRGDTALRYTHILRNEHAAYMKARAWFYQQERRWQDAPFWRRRTRICAGRRAAHGMKTSTELIPGGGKIDVQRSPPQPVMAGSSGRTTDRLGSCVMSRGSGAHCWAPRTEPCVRHPRVRLSPWVFDTEAILIT